MKKLLEEIRKRAKSEFDSGADAETFRIKYLGKKGELTAVLRQMGTLSA